jgi:malate permease and related proteins
MLNLIEVFIPLALLIGLGFVMGRLAEVDLKTIAKLAIFGFTPVVGFGAVAQLNLSVGLIILPVLAFLLATIVGLITFYLARYMHNKQTFNYLLPLAAGSGNTGYFGFPLALALLGPIGGGVYLVANLGVVIYESTIGYYFVERNSFSPRQALQKVLQLPILSAIVLGSIVSLSGFQLNEPLLKFWELSKGVYICLGMMILGVALGKQKLTHLDFNFACFGLIGKFVFWPLLVIGIVLLDKATLSLLTPVMHQSLVILSLAPMAANLVNFTAHSGGQVGQVASLVLLSTVIAVCGIPFFLPILISLIN